MSFITLSEAKAHLRVTDSAEDALIQIFIDAACGLCEEYCARPFGSEAPKTVKAAALLIISDLDKNREAQITTPNIQENRTLKALLFSHIDFDGQNVTNEDTDLVGMLRGDTWIRDWQWLEDDGTPINITGYIASLKFDDVVYPATITDAAQGRIEFEFTPLKTSEFTAKRTLYSLTVTSPGGEVTTLDRKSITIL